MTAASVGLDMVFDPGIPSCASRIKARAQQERDTKRSCRNANQDVAVVNVPPSLTTQIKVRVQDLENLGVNANGEHTNAVQPSRFAHLSASELMAYDTSIMPHGKVCGLQMKLRHHTMLEERSKTSSDEAQAMTQRAGKPRAEKKTAGEGGYGHQFVLQFRSTGLLMFIAERKAGMTQEKSKKNAADRRIADCEHDFAQSCLVEDSKEDTMQAKAHDECSLEDSELRRQQAEYEALSRLFLYPPNRFHK
jgi:hypothetical protein